jgi:hypothetical protein
MGLDFLALSDDVVCLDLFLLLNNSGYENCPTMVILSAAEQSETGR